MTEIITTERPICGAQLRGREQGRVCQQTHVMPNGRCRIHGGATPRGVASANFQTGRYSKHVPTQLISTYERARTDSELLNLTDDIALGEARITELLGKLAEQTSLLEAIQQVSAQIKEGETHERTITKIQTLAEQLKAMDTSIWAELREVQEKKRKLVEAERRRLKDIQAMVDIREVMVLLARFEDIVSTCISVPNDKILIGRELQRLTQDGLFTKIAKQQGDNDNENGR